MSDSFYSELPTAKAVDNIINEFEQADREARDNTAYRMENYFNCVDDYSWGGPCDQAQDRARFARQRCKEALLAQLVHGGAYTDTFDTSVLCDLQGNIVSEKIINGKFGPCWIIGSGDNISFVGVAKKASTYEKKGYQVKTRRLTVEYYFTGKIIKGNVVTKGRIISNEITNSFPTIQTTEMNSIAYYAN